MKIGLVCVLLLTGCGCPLASTGETARDAGEAEDARVTDAGTDTQPTIFCHYIAQQCSQTWWNSVIVTCTGALNEDAGGCVPMAGAAHQYCCPVGDGASGTITCADIADTDQYQAPTCAADLHCCVTPWARSVSRACCNDAGWY